MNYKDFALDDWIGHINEIIEDEDTLDGNKMRDLVEFLTTMQEPCGDCISREKTLEKFCDYVGAGMSMNDFDALYDIVAKMPSVQPKTEPCEDCVSRVNAIATIKNLYPDMPIMDIMGARRKWQEKYSQYIECEKEIERLPSVQPEQEPKMGHWIMHDRHRECSKCGVWLLKDMSRNSYCPNCGAKMESEETTS